MEAWDREALYNEVWEQPAIKLAAKYGISAVMLGKVCRKLQIPRPGRGYWAKKEFGKPVQRLPLPKAKDLPVVHRLKLPGKQGVVAPEVTAAEPVPTDPEYLRIVDIESRSIPVDLEARQHRLVSTAAKALRRARVGFRGMLEKPWQHPCLDLRVSTGALDRALAIANTVILTLEEEGFPVSVEGGKHGTTAQVFGHKVPFTIVEKHRVKSRREVQETPNWRRYEIEYEPTGDLEFRVGQDRWGGWKCGDGKKRRLEELLPRLVGAVVRDGRDRVLAAERAKQEAIERHKRELERMELARQIQEEEKNVRQLESWVSNWAKAREMRSFIGEVEKLWIGEGHDLSPQAPKGQRIAWMKQQAERLDPLVLNPPPSVLDRRSELDRYW